jgi:hypothetical protein
MNRKIAIGFMFFILFITGCVKEQTLLKGALIQEGLELPFIEL